MTKVIGTIRTAWYGFKDGLLGYPPMFPTSWPAYREPWILGRRLAFWRKR